MHEIFSTECQDQLDLSFIHSYIKKENTYLCMCIYVYIHTYVYIYVYIYLYRCIDIDISIVFPKSFKSQYNCLLFPGKSGMYLAISILKPRIWKSNTVIHLYAWLNPLSHRKVFLPCEPFYISKLLPLPMKIIASSSFHLCIMKIQFPFPLSFYLFF